MENKRFIVLSALLILFVVIIVIAPNIARHDPLAVNLNNALAPMSLEHYFGTDQLGRDVYSRVLYGGQISLGLAFVVVFITSMIGAIIGGISGVIGGLFDRMISSFLDIWLALPDMVMSIALIGILGPSLENVVVSLVVVKWAEYARIIRSMVMTIKNSEYVCYATMSGAGISRILKVYIIPNVVSPLIVVACQHIGEIIMTIAGFSLIGIGVQPPMPEWGSILMGSKDYMQIAPWLLFCPGGAIFIAVILFNWWGDELRDVLDPHL